MTFTFLNWSLKSLKNDIPPFPDSMGNYIIYIPSDKFKYQIHGQSHFIYIRGMGKSKNASLSKRIGEFVSSALGFCTYHSAGQRFLIQDLNIKTNPWDLIIWW